jgi:hypothetical protein
LHDVDVDARVMVVESLMRLKVDEQELVCAKMSAANIELMTDNPHTAEGQAILCSCSKGFIADGSWLVI